MGLHLDLYPEDVADENSSYYVVNGLTANGWNQVTIDMSQLGTGDFNKVDMRLLE